MKTRESQKQILSFSLQWTVARFLRIFWSLCEWFEQLRDEKFREVIQFERTKNDCIIKGDFHRSHSDQSWTLSQPYSHQKSRITIVSRNNNMFAHIPQTNVAKQRRGNPTTTFYTFRRSHQVKYTRAKLTPLMQTTTMKTRLEHNALSS